MQKKKIGSTTKKKGLNFISIVFHIYDFWNAPTHTLISETLIATFCSFSEKNLPYFPNIYSKYQNILGIKIDNQKIDFSTYLFFSWCDEWMDGWMDGWMVIEWCKIDLVPAWKKQHIFSLITTYLPPFWKQSIDDFLGLEESEKQNF